MSGSVFALIWFVMEEGFQLFFVDSKWIQTFTHLRVAENMNHTEIRGPFTY